MANNEGRQVQFDWKSFQKTFGDRFPFLQSQDLEKLIKDPGGIEKYVQDVLNKSLPQTPWFQGGSPMMGASSGLKPDVFETHRSVIVRVPIPENVNPYAIKLGLVSSRLVLEGLPDHKKVEINLPALVRGQGSRASFKDGILEIRMPKDRQPGQKKTIPIDME